MKLLSALDFGYSDAENYKLRQNKALFNRVFFRNEPLERLCQDTTYFLVGDKGTGKTAYAVYLANNEFQNMVLLPS
jgi:polynucleotide 5'-kinase involved in rRNA processing